MRRHRRTSAIPGDCDPAVRRRLLSGIEFLLAAAVIAFDILQPTLVVLVLAALSVAIRKEKISILGFKMPGSVFRMVTGTTLLVLLWSGVLLGLIMPVLNRIFGETQNLSAFESLRGNPSRLLVLLALSWTLAALGEEIVYRGYLQHVLGELTSGIPLSYTLSLAVSSIMFGLAHREQGRIGVVVTALDAVVISLVRRLYGNNLWAAVLFYGISNTLGIITFYFTGPIYGFW